MRASGWLAQARGASAKWLIVTVVGWVALAIGFALDGRRALHSYLTAYIWALSLALGALAFLAIINAMNATWPIVVRRLAEQIAATLPLFAILFIPIFIGMSTLFPWMKPDLFRDPHLHHLVMHRRAYYNVPFFVVRWLIAFAVWIGLALLLRRQSLQQDWQAGANVGQRLRQRMYRLGVAGLIPLALTFSTASFDWLMSLTPTWYSSVFGIYFFAGVFLSGLAVVTLAASVARGRGFLTELRPSHYHALGRLLLAFTAFWAYIAYFQFMLIWIANRPLEGAWFAQREALSWRWLSMALALGQFVVPFVLLLSFRLKRSRRGLGWLAAWILVFRYVDAYWLVMPSHASLGFRPDWMDAAALVAVAGTTALVTLGLLRRHSLVAAGDPRLARAFEYEAR